MIPRYSRPELVALWSDEAKYQLWLEIETLALEAMVEVGVAPASALKSVQERGAFDIKRIDEIESTVKHDVIAFLTSVAEHVGDDARYLHFGMTSSDLLDTAFSVQLCRATDLILAALDTLLLTVKSRAMEHKMTLCIGRSHGIHAEPMTFGLKLASLYAELERQRHRLAVARDDAAVGAISGPVGTFAHLPPSVEEHVCRKLGLKPAPVSTQVIARDVHAALFLACAQVASTLERMMVEIRHLQRTEVREAEEPFSKGQKGSSAMPHKRNPILSENVTGLARLVRGWAQTSLENIPLWHERDISHSSVERVIGPDITITLDFMIARVNTVFTGLQIYPENMKRNVELTRGLVYSSVLLPALTAKGLSREEAYAIVQEHALETWDDLNRETPSTKTFRQRIEGDSRVAGRLSTAEIEAAFSPERHLAHVEAIYTRVFGAGS